MKNKNDTERYANATMMCACSNFRKATRSVTQLFDRQLQACGLRSTQLILLLEISVAATATIPHLSRQLVMDKSTVTRNLAPMLNEGWIEATSGEGRRKKIIRVTPKGQRVLACAVPVWETVQKDFTSGLGHQRWRRLFEDLSLAAGLARGISNQ